MTQEKQENLETNRKTSRLPGERLRYERDSTGVSLQDRGGSEGSLRVLLVERRANGPQFPRSKQRVSDYYPRGSIVWERVPNVNYRQSEGRLLVLDVTCRVSSSYPT